MMMLLSKSEYDRLNKSACDIELLVAERVAKEKAKLKEQIFEKCNSAYSSREFTSLETILRDILSV